MQDGKPSGTARRVAMRRASHQLLDEPRLLDDPFALRILGAETEAELRADPQALNRHAGDLALRAFVVVRSRIAEDALTAAVAAGIRQYVVLGAGLDTFAYRNPFPELRVFEVDFPVRKPGSGTGSRPRASRFRRCSRSCRWTSNGGGSATSCTEPGLQPVVPRGSRGSA